jgi:hypothetical protein
MFINCSYFFYYQVFSFYFRKKFNVYFAIFVKFFFGGSTSINNQRKKIGRKKFEKNKKQKGIGTSNTILKRQQ